MMLRRTFFRSTTAGLVFLPSVLKDLYKTNRNTKNKSNRILNAYYLRAHMYTMVPRQVRDDLKWMKELGTDIVSVAILEQDLFAAVENIAIICNEASKLGMRVFGVPSRWGGMFAGAPKVPSLFTIKNPQTWVLQKNGKPYFSQVSGAMSSTHYPETLEFFKESVDKLYELWDIAGIIWDEPKSFREDFSPLAVENLGKNAPVTAQYRAVVDFYNDLNQYLKEKHPAKEIALFGYSNWDDEKFQAICRVKHLDHFGCDGRPWYDSDGGKNEGRGKVLLGEKSGERYLRAATENNYKSLWLIENHNMLRKDAELMDKRFPEILDKKMDHLIYYYYPRNLEDPEMIMSIIAKHLRNR